MIERLADTPDESASASLETLLVDPALSLWRELLSQAREAQLTIRRDARFRHPDIEQVCRTLDGGRPANAADLSTLVADTLGELAVTIETGKTDDWRQYWNEDPATPKHEHRCRERCSRIFGHACRKASTRSPRGSTRETSGPTYEFRAETSRCRWRSRRTRIRNLWSALRHQLIEQYASVPETDGCGIYLVFWFGKSHTQPHPSSTLPGNPRELQRQLEALLSDNEARKIAICVIDVSGDSRNASTPMRHLRP